MAACRNCGAELPLGARFCHACGAPQGEPAAADELLKLATVLFADIVSSTARAERMHPEDVRALMAEYFEVMAAEIRAEGGTIEKFIGDAIMAVFGVPTAHEDDPARAVRAARRMLARLDEWNGGRADPLEIRIGVNTGDVLASPHDELLVTGDAVNVAARLEQAAGAGQVLVGERTARLVRGTFELEPIDALELKGKAASVAAWRVVAERAAPAERGIPGLQAPLVGREAELEILRSLFSRVRGDRAPQLVTVIADAGVGKSRLVREFVGGLDVGAKVLVGRCPAYGEGVTLWPLGEILKAEAVVLENDPPADAHTKIAALVAETMPPELAPDRKRTAEALASTLGLGETPEDPREAYRALVSAWRAMLTALAAAQPLVLIVEDIHWADETMLDVLDDLSEHVEGPLLIVCTARPDLLRLRPGWGGGRRNYSSLPLDPLTPEETGRLVGALLDVDELPLALRQRILERSEGNPFFLEEIIRRLIDEDAIRFEDGRWRARGNLADVDVPDDVQAVILARIDLLEPAERRALRQAAVIGRTFWRGSVARLVGDDRLDDVLRTLVRRELVVERIASSMGGDVEYSFKHVLIRDVAYESLPRRERARAHAAAAAWIEEVSGERASELVEFLAHHNDSAFALSGDEDARARAVDYYLQAARRAISRFAVAQAERFGARAAELATPGVERATLLERLAYDVYRIGSLGDDAWQAYVDAIAEGGAEAPATARLAAEAAVTATRWHGTMHGHPPAQELDDLIALGLRAAGPDDSRERALLQTARAFMPTMGYTARDRSAAAAGEEALAIATRLDAPDLQSAAYDATGALLLDEGQYARMQAIERRRIELLPRLHDSAEIGDTYAMAAWSAFFLGAYEEGLSNAEKGAESSRGVNPGSFQHCLTFVVLARFTLGDWDGALRAHAEMVEVVAGDPRELPPSPYIRAYAGAALCHELRGETGEADALLDLVVGAIRDGLLRPGLLGGCGAAARALAHRGRASQARELFAWTGRGEGSAPLLEALCEVAPATGDWDYAAHVLELARKEAAECDLLALPHHADRLEGRIAAASGRANEAGDALRRSAQGFARLKAPWEEAYSRLLQAELTSETDGLPEALATFERLKSPKEAVRASELLSGAAEASRP